MLLISFAIILHILLLLVAYLIYSNKKSKERFESNGVVYTGNGTIRFIKNNLKGIGFLEGFTQLYASLRAQNAKIAGGDEFGRTTFIILEPETVKSILVKDFEHFSDRTMPKIQKGDYLFAKMLIALRGDEWKSLRSKLSPTFTTGKIKRLFKLFDESGKKLAQFIEREMMGNVEEMELGTAYSKFAMDVIASAVCGMDSQAFQQKEASLFEKMGAKLQIKFGGSSIFKILILNLSPKLGALLGVSLFEKNVQDFFFRAIQASIRHRRKSGDKGNDFLQLMMDAKDGKLKLEESELDAFEKEAMINGDESGGNDDNELLNEVGIAANAVLFILAGYDTTQSLLLFLAYALALNPEVQEKLREEIDAVLYENDGEFTYDALNGVGYFDMVINETLRFYPPAGMTDRRCTADYKVPGTKTIIKKGESISISIYGMHHDPEYFPNPEKFDPERFSPENKGKIIPYTFLPFGHGPRNCIGMRFALIEVKVAIAHLVHNFKIEPSPRTSIPMKYADMNSLKPKDGMYLALNKIH